MTLFLTLLIKLLPIYATMGMGMFLSRQVGNIAYQLGVMQIYFITPLVVCTKIMHLEFDISMMALPVTMFFICIGIASAVYHVTRIAKNDAYSILGQGSGTANTGYLGVPVALIVLPADQLPLYMFGMVATVIFENSLGYYFAARGQFSPREAILKLLKLPTLYALIIGVVLGQLNIAIPSSWENFERDLLGAYVVLGALIIGFGLSGVKWHDFNVRFVGIFLGIKFIIWPLVTFLIVLADQNFVGLLTPDMHKILLLMSFLPMAANTVAFAALFKTYPSQAAVAVALSTLFGLIAIPFYVTLFGL